MSTDSDQQRPSFRFRDKFSRLKDKVKDKIKDKVIRHNATLLVHQNLTSNDTDTSRHGFRQHMHHYKDVLKNKTHYESIKDKIKDKIDEKFDLHDNKTYPKGFYDSLFSPETENDVYLQTALICLWVIALLCIIPTIIVIFLPAKKKATTTSTNTELKATTTSTNMIFFHIFLCELCYLTYVLLAMINVAKDFRLGSLFCDFANYGMYITIPIMQFALLFLSLERLSKHFNLSMTWAKIFTKPYLIQAILCITWVVLIALLVTFMFIKKQFNFNFIKDKVYSLAPPILGDVAVKLASRRHHCSIDGRLSSVFKTVIIILFVILVIKPILFSLGFNLLTPYCCKTKRKDLENHGDRRTTTLVTIFLLLNFFFSFPFYFASMFNSILTNIDSTKDTFNIVLKLCFILRIVNIIFECLAFYIFERNSWDLLRKLFYYATCKKCPIFNRSPDDHVMYSKDPEVQDIVHRTRLPSNEDEDDGGRMTKKNRKIKTKTKPLIESEPDGDNDDDGGFRKVKKKQSITKKDETPVESDDDKTPVTKRKTQSNKKTVESDEDEEKETKKVQNTRRSSQIKKVESDEDDDEDEDEPKQVITSKRISQIKQQESDNDKDEENYTKRKSRPKKPASDDDNEEEEHETKAITKRKSRPKVEVEEEEEEEEEEVIIKKPKAKSRPKVEAEEEEEEEMIKKPKSHRTDVEIRVPNGKPTSHRPSSSTNTPKTTKSSQRHSTSSQRNINRHSTQPSPSPDESEVDKASNASQSSAKMIKPSASSKTIKPRSSSKEQKRTRNVSPNDQRSHHRKESSPSSRPKEKATTSSKSHHNTKTTRTHAHTKKPKKDRETRLLEMSDEV